MLIINKTLLDAFNEFRCIASEEIKKLFSTFPQFEQNKIYYPEYRLFINIVENFRMDLNYTLSYDIEYDLSDFSGIYRNIRNSIESYYDLYNLSKDYCNYFYLLLRMVQRNYCNFQPQEEIPDFSGKNRDLYKEYVDNPRKKFLTIADKGNIAKTNGFLNEKKMKDYTIIANEANSRVHPNPFIPPTSIEKKNEILLFLLVTDCEILCNSCDLFIDINKENLVDDECTISIIQSTYSKLSEIVKNERHPLLSQQ